MGKPIRLISQSLRCAGLLLLVCWSALPRAAEDGADPELDLEARESELQADFDAYEVGLEAAREGDFDTALPAFLRAAEAGVEVAQYNLGVMYYEGRGVEQDFSEAYHWTRMAAEQGHTAAQFNLAVLYFNGQGVNPLWRRVWPMSLFSASSNRQSAAAWYERAASAGHAEAQYNLATMYQNGWGVDNDHVRAHFWAQAARENEHPGASPLLEELEREMSAEQRSEARRIYAEQTLQR